MVLVKTDKKSQWWSQDIFFWYRDIYQHTDVKSRRKTGVTSDDIKD